MSFVNSEVQPHLANWFKPLVGRRTYDQKNVETASNSTNEAIAILEKHFLKTDNKFFLGQEITLADLFAASSLSRGFQYVFDNKWQSKFPRVTEWFSTVIQLPVWRAVIPKFDIVQEAVSRQGQQNVLDGRITLE